MRDLNWIHFLTLHAISRTLELAERNVGNVVFLKERPNFVFSKYGIVYV